MTNFRVYFAGELFDHKHLIGNAILAEAIERYSERRYTCVLPQDLELSEGRAVAIRNLDLKQVMACDLGLFNFDGTDVDAGTVVEIHDGEVSGYPRRYSSLRFPIVRRTG